MSDRPSILVLLLFLFLGVVIFYVGRQIWVGILEARQEFLGRKDSKPDAASGANAEQSTEENQSREKQQRQARSWHEVLDVSPTASLAEIKVAYRNRISRYHPDRVAGLGEELRILAEEHAKEINEAYALACKSCV